MTHIRYMLNIMACALVEKSLILYILVKNMSRVPILVDGFKVSQKNAPSL